MSSRRLQQGRPRGRPSASTSRRNANSTIASAELPPYEPPTCPLTEEAKRTISNLSNSHDTRTFDKHLQDSIRFLSDAVQATNDRLTDRRAKLGQLKQRRENEGGEEKTARERYEEKAVKRLQEEVPGLTADCEKAIRRAVDLNVQVEDEKAALAKMSESIEDPGPAPAAAVLERRRRRPAEDGLDEDMDLEEPAEVSKPLQVFQESRDALAADYVTKSLYQRYALNNDYVGFKKLWHESTHEEGIPVPDPSRWFTDDDGEVLPANDHDDDDEFIVARETTSLNCPLSLQVMKEPYGTKKCPHVFEQAAIREYLGGRVKKCPQAGCDADISPKDLYLDQVVLRRIKRSQAHASRNHGRSDALDEDIDEDGDTSMAIMQERDIKRERVAANRGRTRRAAADEEEEEEEGV